MSFPCGRVPSSLTPDQSLPAYRFEQVITVATNPATNASPTASIGSATTLSAYEQVKRCAPQFVHLPQALLIAGRQNDAVICASAVLAALPDRRDVRCIRAHAAAALGCEEYALGDVEHLLAVCGPDPELRQLHQYLTQRIGQRQWFYRDAP